MEYLREHEPEISKTTLEVYGLEVAERSHADEFTLEFVAVPDESHAWRVEFEAGEPKRTGFKKPLT